ncbi:MAG TPA: hypothetical protein VI197_21700 [Polyangiaceae bacterium]
MIALQPVLEHIAGRRFVLDDRVQDASFFADLSIQTPGPKPNWIDTVFALRFSNFADLFSTWSHGPETLDHAVAKELVAAVAAAGFHFVPYEALQEPYTGRCGAIRPKVWWIRFFDYL